MSQGKPKTELCSCSCRKHIPLDEIAMSNVRLEVYHEAFVGILFGKGLTWGPYTPQMCMNVFYRQCSSKKVLHWANISFSAHAKLHNHVDTQPVKRLTL